LLELGTVPKERICSSDTNEKARWKVKTSQRRGAMKNAMLVLIGLSCLGFVMAVLTSAFIPYGHVMGISAEAFSRASNNLALIAIALAVCCKEKPAAG
jgi:hypothetical protein